MISFNRFFPVLLIASALLTAQENSKSNQPPARRDTVVVTGSYEPVPLEEADRSVRLLEVPPLELVSNSIADFLKLEPSLDLRQRSPNAVQADLSIRGSTFGQTLVLMDGIRMNDAQSGHHHMNLPIPIEALARVEILKGSGSTFYGSDAVGGVVNLIPRRPESSEVRVRAAAGNFGVNQQRITGSYASDRLSQQLSVSRDFSSGFTTNRDYRNLSLSSLTYLNTRLGLSRFTLAHNDRPFGAQGFYGNFPSWERTKAWFASLRQDLGQRTEVSFAYRRHTDLFVLYRDQPQRFTNRHANETYNAALRRRESLGGNATLHWGFEGYGDSIVSNNLGAHDRARGAGYAALDVRALKRFSFTLGIRDEVWGSFNHQWSPSLAAGVWLNPNWKIRGSVSRAFRLPTYTDLYYQDPGNRGSPDLRPEQAWSYEGGVDWSWRGRLRATGAVFQRRERDGIDYVRANPTDIWRATNFQRLRFTGFESALGWTVARKQLVEVMYTGLSGAQDTLTGLQSKYVFNYPVHSGIVSWQGDLGKGWMGRVRTGSVQRLARETYTLLDVYAARTAGQWHPFVQLTNLTGARYEEIPGVPMAGRGVVVGLEWVWRP